MNCQKNSYLGGGFLVKSKVLLLSVNPNRLPIRKWFLREGLVFNIHWHVGDTKDDVILHPLRLPLFTLQETLSSTWNPVCLVWFFTMENTKSREPRSIQTKSTFPLVDGLSTTLHPYQDTLKISVSNLTFANTEFKLSCVHACALQVD